MKNFLYFITGLIYLPIMVICRCIIYVRDLGKDVIEMRKLNKRLIKFNENHKRQES